MQVVAFDTAGCPALLTGKELDAWIAYAKELEGEGTRQDPPSFTEMRARIVRGLVKAQASSLLRISRDLLSAAEVASPGLFPPLFWLRV
jgi:hypothetical protein